VTCGLATLGWVSFCKSNFVQPDNGSSCSKSVIFIQGDARSEIDESIDFMGSVLSYGVIKSLTSKRAVIKIAHITNPS
jgi:hypothetical protein